MEFTLFPNLAVELRVKIFEYAIPQRCGRKLSLCITGSKPSRNHQVVFKITQNADELIMSPDIFNLALSITSYEAREVYKRVVYRDVPPVLIPRVDGGVIPFNASNTTILIRNLDAFIRDSKPLTTIFGRHNVFIPTCLKPSSWSIHVKHIATFCFPLGQMGLLIYEIVYEFPNLQSLTWLFGERSSDVIPPNNLAFCVECLVAARKHLEGDGKDMEIIFMNQSGYVITESELLEDNKEAIKKRQEEYDEIVEEMRAALDR